MTFWLSKSLKILITWLIGTVEYFSNWVIKTETHRNMIRKMASLFRISRTSSKVILSIRQAFLTLSNEIVFQFSFEDCRAPSFTKLWKIESILISTYWLNLLSFTLNLLDKRWCRLISLFFLFNSYLSYSSLMPKNYSAGNYLLIYLLKQASHIQILSCVWYIYSP